MDARPKKSFKELCEIPTFCAHPFLQVAVMANGQPQSCCNHLRVREAAENFEAGDINQYWKSDYLQELRNSLLQGKPHKDCSRCWHLEKVSGASMRTRYLRNLDSLPEEQRKNLEKRVWEFEENQSVPDGPSIFDLKLGNICNLGCRMCSPDSSSFLAKEAWRNREREDIPEVLYKGTLTKMEIPDWYESDLFRSQIDRRMEFVRDLRFTGGEPMATKAFHSLIAGLVHSGQAEKMRLQVVTNGTFRAPETVELIKKFGELDFEVSVDAKGDLLNYIRYPSSWSGIKRNLQYFKEQLGNRMKVHVTVQLLNIMNLSGLLEWLLDHEIKWSLSSLTEPKYLEISLLPETLKKNVMADLEAIFQKASAFENYRYPCEDLKDVLKHLQSSNKDEEFLLEEFFNQSAKFDLLRGQRLGDHLPELVRYSEGNRLCE